MTNGLRELRQDKMAIEFNEISTQQVNTFETGPQTLVGSTTLLGGGYVVLWETYTEDGLSQEIWGQAFSPTGETVGSNFRVTGQNILSVTQGDDGGFIVQYSTTEAQIFSSAGEAGDWITLEADDWRNHDNIFLLDNGNILTTFVETRELPFGEAAYFLVGTIQSATGQSWSLEEMELATSRLPEIVALDSGGFTVC